MHLGIHKVHMKAFDFCIGFVIGVMMSAKISQNNNRIGLSH